MMVAAIEKIIELLSSSLDGITVEFAYKSDLINRPITSQSVYISSDEFEVDTANGSFNFIVYVYSPLKDGGASCIQLAETVGEKLLNIDYPVSGLEIGSVSYNSSSGAFETVIKGVSQDESFGVLYTSGKYNVLAYSFESDNRLSVTLKSCKITVDADYSPHPIMTFCSGKPVAVADGDPIYKITVDGISDENIKTLKTNGTFTLRVENDNRLVDFYKCYCESSSLCTDFANVSPRLNIVSYDAVVVFEYND